MSGYVTLFIIPEAACRIVGYDIMSHIYLYILYRHLQKYWKSKTSISFVSEDIWV